MARTAHHKLDNWKMSCHFPFRVYTVMMATVRSTLLVRRYIATICWNILCTLLIPCTEQDFLPFQQMSYPKMIIRRKLHDNWSKLCISLHSSSPRRTRWCTFNVLWERQSPNVARRWRSVLMPNNRYRKKHSALSQTEKTTYEYERLAHTRNNCIYSKSSRNVISVVVHFCCSCRGERALVLSALPCTVCLHGTCLTVRLWRFPLRLDDKYKKPRHTNAHDIALNIRPDIR